MASVHSPIRDFLKPILFRLMGRKRYAAAQTIAKIRDIDQRLVEEDEMTLLPQILEPDSVAIDVGANYMYYAIEMARLASKGKIYAFEPIPFTYGVAKRVLAHYGLSNIELYDKGVGEKNGQLDFEVPLQDFGAPSAGLSHIAGRDNAESFRAGTYTFRKSERVQCEVVAIDSFLSGLQRLDFVKIDIEGADLFALRGMRNTVMRLKPIILIEVVPSYLHGFGLTEATVRDEIIGMGYSIYVYSKASNKLLPAPYPFAERNHILLPNTENVRWKQLL